LVTGNTTVNGTVPKAPLRHRSDERLVADLVPYARNARTHSPAQVKEIAASITEFGFTNPVLVDEVGMIVAGHGRVLAAQRLGLVRVPVVVLEGLTELQKRAYVLADNKIALNAGWDEALLKAELQDLSLAGFDMDLTGFDTRELTGVLVGAQRNRDPNATPPVPKVARTLPADVWMLGAHRVGCGDAREAGAVDRVMDGAVADVCWTDPPYNVAYQGRAGTIQNDAQGDAAFRAFLDGAFASMARTLREGGGHLRGPR
jgi:ParB-like nuclease domain